MKITSWPYTSVIELRKQLYVKGVMPLVSPKRELHSYKELEGRGTRLDIYCASHQALPGKRYWSFPSLVMHPPPHWTVPCLDCTTGHV
nr:hypothetical protein CFP56_48625 [Quercus suber]